MVPTATLRGEACSGGGGPALCPSYVRTRIAPPANRLALQCPDGSQFPGSGSGPQQPAALVDAFWGFPSRYTETVPLFRALLSDKPSPSLGIGWAGRSFLHLRWLQLSSAPSSPVVEDHNPLPTTCPRAFMEEPFSSRCLVSL